MYKHTKKHYKNGYFEGIYLKHTNASQVLALIPSVHTDQNGKQSASLQIITNEGAWQRSFKIAEMRTGLRAGAQHFYIRMGGCIFTQHGCRIKISDDDLQLEGRLIYGPLAPLRYDIMGPFCCLPRMECRHAIFSMLHTVSGELTLNGTDYRFQNGTGYIEGDRGCSFPKHYIWTQFNNKKLSIFMSAATIPLGKWQFTGCIASIWHKGKEYRMATYLGAKVTYADERKLVLRQKNTVLSAELMDGQPQPHPLLAPASGGMQRWIGEKAACRVRYQLWNGDRMIFDVKTGKGSFEGELG